MHMDGSSAIDINTTPVVVETASAPQPNSAMPDTSSADITGCGPEAAPAAQIPASVESAAGSGDAPSDAPKVQKDPLLEAFEAQHAAVQADPGDFNKLVGLISAADKLVRDCRK